MKWSLYKPHIVGNEPPAGIAISATMWGHRNKKIIRIENCNCNSQHVSIFTQHVDLIEVMPMPFEQIMRIRTFLTKNENRIIFNLNYSHLKRSFQWQIQFTDGINLFFLIHCVFECSSFNLEQDKDFWMVWFGVAKAALQHLLLPRQQHLRNSSILVLSPRAAAE